MIVGYFMLMLSMAGPDAGKTLYFSYGGIAINLFTLLAGILKNPGIP